MYTPHFFENFQQLSAFFRIIPFVFVLAGINLLYQKTKDKGALIMVVGSIIMAFPFMFFLFHSLHIISSIIINFPNILIPIMIHVNTISTIIIGIGLIIFGKNFVYRRDQLQ